MKLNKKLLAAGAVVAASVQSAYATVVTDAQTAFTQAGSDASTMGGYVITAVVGVAAIGILLSVVKKV